MSPTVRTRIGCGQRGQLRRLPSPADDPPADGVFGIVIFDGRRQARRVVLAFDSRAAANAYAVEYRLPDYVVVPLSFLAPAGVAARV